MLRVINNAICLLYKMEGCSMKLKEEEKIHINSKKMKGEENVESNEECNLFTVQNKMAA